MNTQLLEQEYKTHTLPGSARFLENFHNKKEFKKLVSDEPKIRVAGHYVTSAGNVFSKWLKHDLHHKKVITNYDELIHYCIHYVNDKNAGIIKPNHHNGLRAATCTFADLGSSSDNPIFYSFNDAVKYAKHHNNINHAVQIELTRWDC